MIEKRIDFDNSIFIKKANEVSSLTNMIAQHIGDATIANNDGHLNIKEISKKLSNMKTPTLQKINNIHTELKNTAKSIENEMKKTNEKLEAGKNDINSLKIKIKSLENELQSTKRENEIDHLTSTLTRKAFENKIIDIENKFQKSNENYAIIFFDIDHFKKVNDNYGHEGGDIILSTFAKILLRSTRDSDIIGRYGGEEFIAVLYYEYEDELINYIKRVKSLITKNRFKYKEHKIAITFSAGLTIRKDNESYEMAVNLADTLLYKAKNSGRNKIICQNGVEI